MLNEKGLAACMKAAWKGRGYTVLATGDMLFLNAKTWGAGCMRDGFPRNCLGLLASHLGALPEDGECWMLQKDAGAQKQIFQDELAVVEKVKERLSEAVAKVRQTPLHLFGFEVWQNQSNFETYCVSEEFSRFLSADAREHTGMIETVFGLPALLFAMGDDFGFVMPRTRNDEHLLRQLDGFPWCGD